MHATADGQACRADHVRTPCATVRVTYSLGRPPYVCRKNVADVATTKTYGQKARTASCDRGIRDVLRESAGRCAGLPSGECGTSSGRVRYVLRESAVRPAGECGTFCRSQTFCSSLLEQRKLEVNDLRPACKQDWTGSGCNIKGAGGFC
ncbi:hypothetical protein Bbelb_309870 [Branchiostoma belcheri]|nr:hypothetical protein Bbelb_309870 [Branchiostoma belcheri]